MAEDLEQLKKVLRALVVSSPSQVDMRSLLRDYRQMVGKHLPVADFGYRDALPFLKERFNDCFVFNGDPRNPVLTPIVPEELKHIDKFVQNQKKSTIVKMKGKRRSIEPMPKKIVTQEPDLIVKTFNQLAIKKVQNGTSIPKSPVPSTEDRNHNFQKLKSPEMDLQNTQVDRVQEDNRVHETPEPKEGSIVNPVHSFLKRRTSLYNSQYVDSASSLNERLSSKDDDSGRQTASSNSIKKSLALEELKQEVVDLVTAHSEGVWCTDLLRLYRERHGRELNFGRFGFTSIISLVLMLDAQLGVSRPVDTGDWLLRPRAPPSPAPPPPPAAPAPRYRRPARPHRPVCNVDPDDALPGIDFDPDVFPEDCVHFMESIPGPALGALCAGALLDVMVGEVYSPSHFWLLRLGDQHHIAMEQLMDEMTEYYERGEGRDRYLAMGAVRVGHYCSSLFDRDWHRSLIVQVLDSDTVKVRHVDYGTVDRVAVAGLKPLLRRWSRLPAQALRARLAGAAPGAAGRRWPHAACARFLDRVRDAKLVASVVAVDREEDILEVFLVNTSTDKDECLSADLIRSGHADPRQESTVRSGECFLFPRFEALENGATPNYAEISAYLRDGISLEYVEDYRRHVPDCLPQRAPLALPPPPPSPSPPPSPRSTPPSLPRAASCESGLSLAEPPPSPPVASLNRVPLFPASIPALPTEPPREPPAQPARPNRSEPALSSPRSSSPPPPAPRPPGGVTLSPGECETFRYLSGVDPLAAHWFMLGALSRAAPPPAPLNASAPEFRPSCPQPQPRVHFGPPAPYGPGPFPQGAFPQGTFPQGPFSPHSPGPYPYQPGPFPPGPFPSGPFAPQGPFMPPPGFGPR